MRKISESLIVTGRECDVCRATDVVVIVCVLSIQEPVTVLKMQVKRLVSVLLLGVSRDTDSRVNRKHYRRG